MRLFTRHSAPPQKNSAQKAHDHKHVKHAVVRILKAKTLRTNGTDISDAKVAQLMGFSLTSQKSCVCLLKIHPEIRVLWQLSEHVICGWGEKVRAAANVWNMEVGGWGLT